MNVIAVGVETEEQLLFLKDLGCHEMQGYFLGPPFSAVDLKQLLVNQKGTTSTHQSLKFG